MAARKARDWENPYSEVHPEENQSRGVRGRRLHQLLGAEFVLFRSGQAREGASDFRSGEAEHFL